MLYCMLVIMFQGSVSLLSMFSSNCILLVKYCKLANIFLSPKSLNHDMRDDLDGLTFSIGRIGLPICSCCFHPLSSYWDGGCGWVPSSIDSSGAPGICWVLSHTLSIFPLLITSLSDRIDQKTMFPHCRLGYYSSTQVLLCRRMCCL